MSTLFDGNGDGCCGQSSDCDAPKEGGSDTTTPPTEGGSDATTKPVEGGDTPAV